MGVGARAQMHVTATGATYPMRMPMEGSLLFRSERYTPICVMFCSVLSLKFRLAQYLCSVLAKRPVEHFKHTLQNITTNRMLQGKLEVNSFFLFQIVSEIA